MSEFNSLHYHEAMDRASMMVEIWESQIESLGVIQSEPELKAAAEKISEALSDFYQLTGSFYFKQEEQNV